VNGYSRPCHPGHLPLVTLRDVIQPFPPFLGVYVAGLKALHNAIMAERGRCWCSVTCGGGPHLCPECDAGE
jgi:hypothetical protein